jgi:hypothetical protein
MHVVGDALEQQRHRRRGLGVDAREDEPGTVVDLAELGFAGVDERPQIGDATSGLRNVGCSSLPPFVSYCSARKVANRP